MIRSSSASRRCSVNSIRSAADGADCVAGVGASADRATTVGDCWTTRVARRCSELRERTTRDGDRSTAPDVGPASVMPMPAPTSDGAAERLTDELVDRRTTWLPDEWDVDERDADGPDVDERDADEPGVVAAAPPTTMGPRGAGRATGCTRSDRADRTRRGESDTDPRATGDAPDAARSMRAA